MLNNDQGKDKDNNGNAKGKDKEHSNNGKHLGWYKNPRNPHFTEGEYDLTNPEIFQVTNYINDLSLENEEVLMTTDVDDNYRGVYTYDNTGEELISQQDLGHVEGVPNDPLYYVKDAIGSVTAITNMNGEIIDSNRFAPYGEALDPVGKNARLTNSPYGFTGETHDIEGGLVYLRARYYEPNTMRFLQQDTKLGDIKEPITSNLYAYAGNNPLSYIDPSGHEHYSKDIFNDEYTWQPDSSLDEGINIASNIPVLGTLGKAGYYYFRFGDANTSGGELALNLTIDAAALLTGGLTKYGQAGYKVYKAACYADVTLKAYSKIKVAVDIVNAGMAQISGPDGSNKFKSMTYEEILYSIIKEADIEMWLTDADKEVLKKRVKTIEDYIKSRSQNFSFIELRKYFEGYFNSEGQFELGYLQKVEKLSKPTLHCNEDKFYSIESNVIVIQSTYEYDIHYFNENWYDKIFFDYVYSFDNERGYSSVNYYKNNQLLKSITSIIKGGIVVEIKTEYYKNGKLVKTNVQKPSYSPYP